MPVAFEEVPQHLAHAFVVIDDEHRAHGSVFELHCGSTAPGATAVPGATSLSPRSRLNGRRSDRSRGARHFVGADDVSSLRISSRAAVAAVIPPGTCLALSTHGRDCAPAE